MSDAADAIEAGIVTPPGKSNLVPILLVLNMLLIGGVGAAVVLRTGHAAEPAAAAEGAKEGEGGKAPMPAVGPVLRLGDFVVRLRNPDVDRYARMSFEVEVATEQDKERIVQQLAKVRDGFIAYLSDRTMEELRGSEALNQIKQRLTDRLHELVPDARVKGLYLTEFVVQ